MKKPAVESPGSNTPASSDLPDSLSLLSLWRILWDRKWSIAIVAFLFAVFGFVIASTGERTYTAESLLVLEDNNAALSNSLSRGGAVYGDPSQAVQIFGSRQAIGRVVDDLDLLNDPEFNPFLNQAQQEQTPSFLGRIVGSVFSGGATEEDATQEGADAVSEAFVRQSTVQAVQDRVRFISDPNTRIIRVVAQTQNPERSAQLANAVSQAFLQDLLETRLESVDRLAEQLSVRVSELRQTVREREAALQDFLNSSDDLDRDSLTAFTEEAQRVRARLARFEQEQARRLTLLAQIEEIAALPPAEQLAQIEATPELAELISGAPGQDLLAALRTAIGGQIDRDQRLILGLQDSLEALNTRIAEASEQQLRYQQLEREVTASTEIYEISVRRLNELRVQGGVESGGGRIVFGAEVPQLPDGRGRVRTAFLLGFLGLVTAIAWVLLREASNQTLRTLTDLQHTVSRGRVVGMPRAPHGRIFDVKAREQRLLLSPEPTEYSEAVRRLRSTLMPGAVVGQDKVVLFTSDFVTASKSMLALGLARSHALLGKSVLVIGADMRDMTLSRHIGQVVPEVTLQDVLSDRQKLEDASLWNFEMGFDLLLPGHQEGSPADILESQVFKSLIELARAEYDVVIVDAPPLLAAPDASLISNEADRVVLVTAADASTAESVIAAIEQLPNGLEDRDVAVLYAAQASKDTQVRVRNRKFARL